MAPRKIAVKAAVIYAYQVMVGANRKRVFDSDTGQVEAFLARLLTKRLKAALLLAVSDTRDG